MSLALYTQCFRHLQSEVYLQRGWKLPSQVWANKTHNDHLVEKMSNIKVTKMQKPLSQHIFLENAASPSPLIKLLKLSDDHLQLFTLFVACNKNVLNFTFIEMSQELFPKGNHLLSFTQFQSSFL